MAAVQQSLRAALVCAVAAEVGAALAACGSAPRGDGETFDAMKARMDSAFRA